MKRETLLYLHARRAIRKDAAVMTHIGMSRWAHHAHMGECLDAFDTVESANDARSQATLRDAQSIANASLALTRNAARDASNGVRHWRYDGVARQGADGRWYDTADLRPTARDATSAPCATVKGSARPILSYSKTSDAALSAPTVDLAASMSAQATASRQRDDRATGAVLDTLVNAARNATGTDIPALATAYMVACSAWSPRYAQAARDAVFTALKACHRGKLRKALAR
jgi:hypothetical protein